MRTTSMLFLFLLIYTITNAQNAVYRLKLYNSFQYFNKVNNDPNSYFRRMEAFQILRLMPAFSIQKRKKELDIVITQLGLGKSHYESIIHEDSVTSVIQTDKASSFDLGFQIGTYWQFKASKKGKVRYSIGSIIAPSISIDKSKRVNESGYKGSLFYFNGYIAPKIVYSIKDNLTLEINMPIQLIGITNYKIRYYNTQFTNAPQTRTTSDVSFLPTQLILNVGLGIKL